MSTKNVGTQQLFLGSARSARTVKLSWVSSAEASRRDVSRLVLCLRPLRRGAVRASNFSLALENIGLRPPR